MANGALTVGQTATRELTVTKRHVEQFAEISGDSEPGDSGVAKEPENE